LIVSPEVPRGRPGEKAPPADDPTKASLAEPLDLADLWIPEPGIDELPTYAVLIVRPGGHSSIFLSIEGAQKALRENVWRHRRDGIHREIKVYLCRLQYATSSGVER
jgi:hypothetical protein